MALVQLSTQGWSPLIDSSGNARAAVGFTLTKLSGAGVTIYTDAARTSTLTTAADRVTSASGEFPGFAAQGEYTLTVGGVSRTVQVVAAGGTIRLETLGGSTDNAAQFATAVALLPASGGTIELGAGEFALSAWPSFEGTTSITIKGQGGRSAGAAPATRIIYSGTAAVNVKSSYGFRLCDLAVVYTSGSLAGKLFDLSHGVALTDTAFASFERCTITGIATTAVSATSLISLANAHDVEVHGCLFNYAVCAIRGKDISGDYSNRVLIEGCEFGLTSQAPVQSAGQAWTIKSCTAEGLTNGNAGFYSQAVGSANAVTIEGLWAGDVNNSGTWIDFTGASTALNVRGSYLTGGATTIALAAFTFGAVIVGNHLEGTGGAALPKGVDVAANCTGIVVEGNDFKPSGVTVVTAPVTLADLPVASRFQFVSGDNTTPTTYIPGKLHIDNYISLKEIAAPSAAGTDRVRVYAVVDGGGKTDLDAIFQTGIGVKFVEEA